MGFVDRKTDPFSDTGQGEAGIRSGIRLQCADCRNSRDMLNCELHGPKPPKSQGETKGKLSRP
jgi:hypothetical protein